MLMSTQGVSSVAVIDDSPAASPSTLLSAVSVTDIGKVGICMRNVDDDQVD